MALTLGVLSGPAAAQTTATKPLRVYFTQLLCEDESNDNTWPNPDHDEPYVLVFSADFGGATPRGRMFISPVFSDVDTGETRDARVSVWGLDGNGAPLKNEVFLVQLMESDDNLNPGNLHRKLTEQLIPKMLSYKQAGISKDTIGALLHGDMQNIIRIHRGDYGDADDMVGSPFRVYYGDRNIEDAEKGIPVDRLQTIKGSDSSYKLTFRLQ
jgi:hypothetical protein